MKFDYCSDLHLDLFENSSDKEIIKYISKKLHKENRGDYIIIAGDIASNNIEYKRLYQILDKWCSENYQMTFVVLGNHDYYGGDLETSAKNVQKWMPSTVVLDFRVSPYFILDDVVLVGTTMWTDVSDAYKGLFIRSQLNDYRAIKTSENGERVTTEDITNEHKKSVEALETIFKYFSDRNIVVVTHHIPTFEGKVKPRLSEVTDGREDPILDNAYYVELSNMIVKYPNIVTWISGHNHKAYTVDIGDTKLLLNCCGYHFSKEAKNFKLRDFEIS